MYEEDATSVLAGKRVAIVSAHFSPEIGYQEVDLARAFTRLGARVRVVTSTRLSPNARTLLQDDYQAGLVHADGYEIVRLSPRATVGPNVLGCNVKPSIAEFGPDHVILVGPGKLFGLELFSSEQSSWQRVVVIQDNSEARQSTSGAPWRRHARAIAHRLVKRPAYRRVVRSADRIIFNVPETRKIVQAWLGPSERQRLALKGKELSLGFDPQRFFFDLAERRRWRQRHGANDEELLLATCTRAVPVKRLEDVIDSVSRLRADGLAVRYVLAGVLDDAYGHMLRSHIGAQPDPTAFLLLPVLGQDEMRELFSACDLGFWPRVAITIQQAMGTGLPVLLKRSATVSHLLTPGRNGWFAEAAETLEEALSRAIRSLTALTAEARVARREMLAQLNRTYLSYDVIARQMIDGLS
jgi:glycosyltransferase involved in cell wall biosynthesis